MTQSSVTRFPNLTEIRKEDVIRRFYRSKQNFWYTYRNLVDRWHLFYNSVEHFQEVAFGKGDQIMVINEDFFELFMRDIRNGRHNAPR